MQMAVVFFEQIFCTFGVQEQYIDNVSLISIWQWKSDWVYVSGVKQVVSEVLFLKNILSWCSIGSGAIATLKLEAGAEKAEIWRRGSHEQIWLGLVLNEKRSQLSEIINLI